jgi:hypothetical protein
MLAGAPNLHRAVAECTQPYASPSAAAARALQARGGEGPAGGLLPARRAGRAGGPGGAGRRGAAWRPRAAAPAAA